MNSQIIDKGNYKLHLYKTDKFKSIEMHIVLSHECKEKNYLLTALTKLIKRTSKYYKNKIDRLIKSEELYCEELSIHPSSLGNLNLITISTSFINPKLVHDDYVEEAIKYPFDIINNPVFDDSNLEELKDDLKYTCRSIFEKPASYANYESWKLFFDHKRDYSLFYVGDEIIDTITMEQIKDMYYELINESNVDIYLLGDIEDKYIDYIDKYNVFKSLNRKYDLVIVSEETSKVKKQIDIKKGVKQAQIYMYYNVPKLSQEDRIKMVFLNSILGIGSDSKLFSTIREKHQLCYSIHSSYSSRDTRLNIFTGVDNKNVDKTIKLIKDLIKDFKEITQDEVDRTRAKLLSNFKTVEDSLYSIFSRLEKEYLEINPPIEEEIKMVESITTKDVETMLDKYKLNTIYVLKDE